MHISELNPAGVHIAIDDIPFVVFLSAANHTDFRALRQLLKDVPTGIGFAAHNRLGHRNKEGLAVGYGCKGGG